ncbi:MAG: carboxypeptidase regulatory-like domain-containing protein [Nitrospiraceae bacterium]|nr:carboxypeptidase regulatory-like domain-containing protein [Nitrospiraceae bacterium]
MAVVVSGLLFFFVPPIQAYEVIDVQEGGTVTGIVTLNGAPPAPKAFNLVTFPDPEYCGRISNGSGWRLLRDFTVDKDGVGGLKDVVVLLEGIEAGKPFDLSVPRVEARDCQFAPFVTIVRDEHAVEVVNMDPVMHDVQAYETSPELGTRVLFNSPLPMNEHHKRGDLHATHRHLPGQSMLERIHLTKGRRVFVMQCGFHAYMESWAFVITNPYYDITGPSGAFAIDHVPPGTYRLIAWHPQTGPLQERTITVKPKGLTLINLSLPAPVGRRTAYEVMENPRFGSGALGRPLEIIPLVERQQ